ncbi:MAG: glycerol-3-phosphate dehydrogenase [Clostridia bacterium]|nr:glycerol-3-phosphate dehydrogenase [Clostridia bacterium]
MKATVLGCGRWGSFITWYLAGQNIPVTEWGREGSAALAALQSKRQNEYVTLSDAVSLTSDLGEAIAAADTIFISISSQGLRELATAACALGAADCTVVLCMKGLEAESGKRLTEIMQECGYDPARLAVWVGPGHIQEFTAGHPNCMVIDGYDPALVHSLVDTLKSNLIRFYYGEDIVGSEVGAAAKNVMGIAAGILDGGGYSSLKGPLMARGAREVARLIVAMGGKELSAYGLCHLGDYETTLFSPYSHNRKFGEMLFHGGSFDKLAEGVYTVRAMCTLGERYGVDLPICRAVHAIIYEGAEPLSELLTLFSRKTVTEFQK